MPLNRAKTVAFDVETGSAVDTRYALQPFRARAGDARITSHAIAMYAGTTIVANAWETPSQDALRAFLQRCIANDLTIVGWNVAFDAAWLCGYGLDTEVQQVKWLDGMLLWQHLERKPESDTQRAKRQKFGLKEAVTKFLPRCAGYEEGIDFFDDSPEMVAKRLRYNKADAVLTLRVTEMLYAALEHAAPRALDNALIEAAAIAPVALSAVHGLHIDVTHAHALRQALTARQDEIGETLEQHGLTRKILASPKQLRAKLYDEWGLPVLVQTDKGAPSTDKVALHLLAPQDMRVEHIREYREAANNRTKFVDKILESVEYNEDGCTRPLPRIYGTYSGRVTYSSTQGRNKEQVQTGFALHQMKRAPEYRKTVKAPPGFVLCEWDAAGQEYRWMAIESGDETMLSLCLPGEDPHSYMGAQIGRCDYRDLVARVHARDAEGKKIRQMGKVGNLACVVADTEVLTPSGPRRIVDVTASDRVWDGVEYVAHDGVVFSGYRKTICYQGLTATPDHQVLCQGEWADFGRTAAEGRRIDTAVWPLDGAVASPVRGQVASEGSLPLRLRARERRRLGLAGRRAQHALQSLCRPSICTPEGAICRGDSSGQATAEAGQRDASAVLQPSEPVLRQLRRERHRVSLRVHKRGGRVGERALAASDILASRDRPHRQQRALRAREFALGHTQAERTQHAHSSESGVAGTTRAVARMGGESVFDYCVRPNGGERADRRTDYRASMAVGRGEAQRVADDGGQVAVYDILNCGPRNRFVANGLIVHNCSYRIGVKKLWITANVDHGMPISMGEAGTIRNAYHRTYPGVQRYWDRQIYECRAKGYAETLAGRRVQLDGSWTSKKTAWQLESSAVNFPIQGVGADQKYLAIKVLQNYLPQFGGRLYFELHDGLYAILPERGAEKNARTIQQALNALPYTQAWGFTPPIPLPWDLKMGPSWGEMVEQTNE